MPATTNTTTITNTTTATTTNNTQNPTGTAPPNGIIPNGHVPNQSNQQANGANNLNNRKVVGKSKWVPLPIDIPKSRKPREPRERNNNVSSNKQRRDTADNDTEHFSSNEANEAKAHPDKPVIS